MGRGGGHIGGGHHGGFHGGGHFGGHHGGFHSYHHHYYHSYGSYYGGFNTYGYGTDHYMDGRPFQYSHAATYRENEMKLARLKLGLVVLAIFIYIIIADIPTFGSFHLTGRLSGTKETRYIYDDTGLLTYDALYGLKNFYNKTGIQPVVFVTDDISYNTCSNSVLDGEYEKLFDDEGHFLLFVVIDDDYETSTGEKYSVSYSDWYGSDVTGYMPSNDIEMLEENLSKVSVGTSADVLSAHISDCFNDAADRWSVTSNVRRGIFAGGMVFLAGALIYIIIRVRKNKREEKLIKEAKPEIINENIPLMVEKPKNKELPEIDRGILADNNGIDKSSDNGSVISWDDAMKDMKS